MDLFYIFPEFITLVLNWQIFKALFYCYKSCLVHGQDLIINLHWQIFKVLFYCYKSCLVHGQDLIINLHFVCMVYYK